MSPQVQKIHVTSNEAAASIPFLQPNHEPQHQPLSFDIQ